MSGPNKRTMSVRELQRHAAAELAHKLGTDERAEQARLAREQHERTKEALAEQAKTNGGALRLINGGNGSTSGPVKDHEIQGRFMIVRKWIKLGEKRLGPGVYHNDGDEEATEESAKFKWAWVCSPLEPLAHSRDKENRNWGRLLEVVDGDGKRHVWAMPATIGPTVGDGTEFRRELVHRGLRIAAGGKARTRLSDFITMWDPKRKVRCVTTVGWSGDAFVMPDKTYGGAEETILQTEGVAPLFATAGSLEGWRSDIAAKCVGNSRLVFGVSSSFTGPLLKLAGEESGGANLKGPSSTGKTTVQHAARSTWGVPLGSWRTTDNGAEAIAAGASDTFLNLDELGQADPKVIAAVSYMLGNQRGKARMSRNATARAVSQWRVFFLSTGEISLADRLREGGIKARAGQEIRVLDIPADAGVGMGIFESLHGFEDAATLAEHIRVAADKNCGHAAIAFIKYVTGNLDVLPAAIAKARTEFIARHCPPGADGQVRRACGRFALVAIAGEIASAAGITGWREGDATAAAARLLNDWLDERGGHGSAETREGLAQVRLFLEQHGEARFTPAWDRTVTYVAANGDDIETSKTDRPTINRAGFRKAVDDGTEFYILPSTWRAEVCKGLNAAEVAKVMAERGWLLPDGDGKFSRPERIPGHGRSRVYVITAAFLAAGA
jgi:putative DNA primase/helicase